MTRPAGTLRIVTAIVALLALVALIALPALAADRPVDRSVTEVVPPAASAKPDKSPKPAKAAKKPKGDPVTVSGTVGTRTDADGRTEYTLTSGSTVVVLEAGPTWFYGADHPLADDVGQQVSITGTQRAGEAEVDVETVDGVAIREPGKPPWAGGWKAVGSAHPGWSQEKADRWAAKRADQAARHGASCWPPGHCKDQPAATGD